MLRNMLQIIITKIPQYQSNEIVKGNAEIWFLSCDGARSH